MRFELKTSTHLLPAAAALLGMLILPTMVRAESPAPRAGHTEPVEAQYRGCQSAGWWRFWIEPRPHSAERLHRVRPDGISQMPGGGANSVAVRDRMNALLASMIHQHKRIVLHGLRELDDGTFAATVTVNGAKLASDPILLALRGMVTGTTR